MSLVNTTFNVTRSGELHRIAACFTFGREDIIPEMFRNMAEEIRKSNSARVERFIYYLDRHIESTPTTRASLRAIFGNAGNRIERRQFGCMRLFS